ncbi:MAG: hypothetical protein IJJ80_08670 [Clostridia bacterium]|nr:hypothetical protein [Clostridia bacterium]
MSRYVIDIDDKILNEQISGILNSALNHELQNRYSETGHAITAAVKDLVYSKKDVIIEMVVDKAVKEIVRKGLPKLLERSGS